MNKSLFPARGGRCCDAILFFFFFLSLAFSSCFTCTVALEGLIIMEQKGGHANCYFVQYITILFLEENLFDLIDRNEWILEQHRSRMALLNTRRDLFTR
jgi:hypothetical protein